MVQRQYARTYAESDGDSTPDEVTRWYKEHGYQFLVLSDHNVLTSVDALNARYASRSLHADRGEEVTSASKASRSTSTASIPRNASAGSRARRCEQILQKSVDAIRAQEGVPHINHPNFNWS